MWSSGLKTMGFACVGATSAIITTSAAHMTLVLEKVLLLPGVPTCGDSVLQSCCRALVSVTWSMSLALLGNPEIFLDHPPPAG